MNPIVTGHTPQFPQAWGGGRGRKGHRRPLGAAGPFEIRSACEKAAEMGFCAYMKSSCQALLQAPWGCLGEVHTVWLIYTTPKCP